MPTNINSSSDAFRALGDIMRGTNQYSWWFSTWDEALQRATDIVNWTYPVDNTVTPTRQFTPSQQLTPFSTLENLNMQSQAWSNTNPNIANAYQNLANWLWSYSNVANQIWDFYNTAANQIADREANYAQAQYNLANQLNQDIANQRNYIMWMFWPEWTLTQEINKYYDDMWNYLASEGWRQMANVAAQGIHSGASLGLLRAQQNEAYNNAFQNYLKVKEQEINAKQSIQGQLIDYMTKLRQEYGNTTNQYILWQYQRANDLLNSLDADLKNQYTNLALARLQGSWSWGSSNDSLNAFLQSLVAWNSSDSVNNLDTNNQNTNANWWYISSSQWAWKWNAWQNNAWASWTNSNQDTDATWWNWLSRAAWNVSPNWLRRRFLEAAMNKNG